MNQCLYFLFASQIATVMAPAHLLPEERIFNSEQLVAILAASRAQAQEVESLQDLIAQQKGEKERALYHLADAVLADAESFQKLIKPDCPCERLCTAFDAQSRKIDEIVTTLLGLTAAQDSMKRSATRVRAADDQLHYALFAKDASPDRVKQLLKRQTRGLLEAAQQLAKAGEYRLGATPGNSVLAGNLRKLAAEVEQFQKELATEKDTTQLRKDFAALNQAWDRVVQEMRVLKAGEFMHLIRAAGQFDRAHERLFRVLGVEGERPQLTLPT